MCEVIFRSISSSYKKEQVCIFFWDAVRIRFDTLEPFQLTGLEVLRDISFIFMVIVCLSGHLF